MTLPLLPLLPLALLPLPLLLLLHMPGCCWCCRACSLGCRPRCLLGCPRCSHPPPCTLWPACLPPQGRLAAVEARIRDLEAELAAAKAEVRPWR